MSAESADDVKIGKKQATKAQRKALDKLETEIAVGKGTRKVTPAKGSA